MYYAIFENLAFEGKERTAQKFYMSLLPHLEKFKGHGFHEDTFSGSPLGRNAVNVAIWDDADAVGRWREEENHLRLQKKSFDTVWEWYRIRLGPEVSEADSASEARHYLTLLYRSNVDGTPPDDVTEVLDASLTSQLKGDIIDSAVFQGEKTFWITAWRSQHAATTLEKGLASSSGDNVVTICVNRDYTKSQRKDAPNQVPGML